MLFLPGLDSKLYWERFAPGMPIPEMACPDPACLGRLLRAVILYRRGGRDPLSSRGRLPA